MAIKAAVHLRSLGCPKNRLDSEVMLGALALAGYAIAERFEDADAAIVNTCSFIESARGVDRGYIRTRAPTFAAAWFHPASAQPSREARPS